MLFTLLSISTVLFEISLSPAIHLFGGEGYVLPSLLVLSAAYGRWRQWLIWLASLLFVNYFKPVPSLFLLALIVLSGLNYVIFIRWLNFDAIWINLLSMTVIISLFIIGHQYMEIHRLSLAVLGSIILTIPIIAMWHYLLVLHRKELR